MNFSCNQQLIPLNYEISCEKKIRPLAYHKKKFRTREKKSLNPQNTHEKKSDPRKMHEKKIRINETPTRKKIRTHIILTKAQWHHGIRPTRPTMARDPRNLGHS